MNLDYRHVTVYISIHQMNIIHLSSIHLSIILFIIIDRSLSSSAINTTSNKRDQQHIINVTIIDNDDDSRLKREFRMNTNKSLTIHFQQQQFDDNELTNNDTIIIDIVLQCRNRELCEIINDDERDYRRQLIFDRTNNYRTSINVTVYAHFLGHTHMDMSIVENNR